MYDDIAAYFHENVLCSYQEFIELINKGSMGCSERIRAAMNAATVLYHLREHLPSDHQESDREISARCPDYGLLGPIVNASKHGELTIGRPTRFQFGLKASDIREVMVLTKYVDDRGEYVGFEQVVEVKLVDNSTRNVGEILTNVINYWYAKLEEIGVLSSSESFDYNHTNHPLTRDEAEKQQPNLKIIKGVRVNQEIHLQEYNYETGTVTPIDLSNATIKATLYGLTQT